MTYERIDDLIALAVLGELSDEERRELDSAAAQDASVARELDEALADAAAIQRTHAEAPPEALRNAVLSAVASTPQQMVVDVTADPVGAVQPPVAPVVSMEFERSRRRFRPTLLAAAAVALFAVGGVVLVATNDDSSDPIAAVIDATDATTRSLSGEIEDLTVIYSASEGALVVQGTGLTVLDDSSTYQLWLLGPKGATSVGTFRPDADGVVAERFPDADPTAFVLGVTEEPAGGSESPTLPILASA